MQAAFFRRAGAFCILASLLAQWADAHTLIRT